MSSLSSAPSRWYEPICCHLSKISPSTKVMQHQRWCIQCMHQTGTFRTWPKYFCCVLCLLFFFLISHCLNVTSYYLQPLSSLSFTILSHFLWNVFQGKRFSFETLSPNIPLGKVLLLPEHLTKEINTSMHYILKTKYHVNSTLLLLSSISKSSAKT